MSPTSLPRLIFINRYFDPDQSATSRLLSDLVLALEHDIVVLTSRQRYDDPNALLPATEARGRVTVRRLAGTRFGRGTLVGRSIDYLSFYGAMIFTLLKQARAGDIVIPMTDPPMLSLLAVPIARRKGCRVVNWLQDLYPEVAQAVGTPLLTPMMARLIKGLRDRSLRAADCNVVIADAMAERLVTLEVKKERIRVIHNWVDDQALRHIPTYENPLRRAWDLENRFVVGYSGNLGRAHDIETILSAARELADSQFIFLCIGGGARYEALKRAAQERGLTRLFRFMRYQSATDLSYSLSLPDVHWISLKPEFEGLLFPSKLYGIAAVGRPIIAITSKNSELARLVSHYDCGAVIEQGDGYGLALELKRLRDAPDACSAMGARAQMMLNSRFTKAEAIRRWKETLREV